MSNMQYLLTLTTLCISLNMFGQSTNLVTSESKIVYSQRKAESKIIDTVVVNIEYSSPAPAAGAAPNANFTPVFDVSSVSLIGLSPKVSSFSPSMLPGSIYSTVAQRFSFVLEIQFNANSELKKDEAFDIVLTNLPAGVISNKHHVVILKNPIVSTDYSQKPFWMEIGANFDLIDGLQPNNFFSGVFFQKRDIRPVFKQSTRAEDKNLAVFAGIYESKTITNTQEQNYSLRSYYDSSSFIPDISDSIKIFRGVGTYINKRVVKNVGLFFSPQVRLTNGSANEDGLHIFGSLWFDLQWQRVDEDRQFSQIKKLDSFRIPIENISDFDNPNFKKETDIRTHYIGVGLPIFFKQSWPTGETVHLFLNPVIGTTSQSTKSYLEELSKAESKGLPLPHKKWNPFYIVQFRLNEEKYGISFTGEVRGLLNYNNPSNPPYISLALSKKFDLTKFIEFNK